MDLLEAILRSKKNIEFGYKHPSYKRACELRKLYMQIVTGSHIENLLPQFELRETPELYNQRVKLTIQNLTPISSPIVKKFYGVSRVDPVEKKFESVDANKQKYIQQAEATFYNGGDVEEYISNYIDRVSIYDPNAFCIVQFAPFLEGEVPKAYPLIFPSPNNYDWLYDAKGQVDFLFSCSTSEYKSPRTGKLNKVNDYFCFTSNNVIEFYEIKEERDLSQIPVTEIWEVKKVQYKVVVRSIASNAIENLHPAKRLGYVVCDEDPHLLVSPLHPSVDIYRDLIRDKSEYDVSKRSHVFPQKVMYDDICPGEVHISQDRRCMNGFIVGTQDQCTVCEGSGFKPHRSGQEIVRIQKPRSKEELIPIDQLITYVTTNLDAIKVLGEDLILNAQRAEAAIFSSSAIKQQSLSGKKDVSKTATEMVISTDEYNYVLDLWAKNRSNMFGHIVMIIGQIFDTRVMVTHRYSGKYVMESIEEQIGRYKSMLEASASPELVNDAEYRIAKAQFDNDPLGLLKFMTKKKFQPFAGKSAGEISFLRQSEYVPSYSKILNDNFNQIFTEIDEVEGEKFYYLKYSEQKAKIDAIVEKIKGEAAKDVPVLNLPKNVY